MNPRKYCTGKEPEEVMNEGNEDVTFESGDEDVYHVQLQLTYDCTQGKCH